MKLNALCLVLAASPCLALPAAPAGDEAAAKAAIAKLVEAWAKGDSPGGAIAVVRGGEPRIALAFGMADVASRRAATPETPFYIASAAKRFTAACVVHAAEAGKLSLADPITKHVAGLPESYGAVTLAQLMHHRGGVKDVYEVAIALDLGPEVLASNEAAVALLRRLPALDFEPGARATYSNSGYVLLAEALRSATKTDLAAYAQRALFEPLGMTHAHVGPAKERAAAAAKPAAAKLASAADAPGDARSYRRDGERWEPIEIVTGLVGPGGVWASVDDLARWERAWLRGEFATASVRTALLSPPELAAGQALHPAFGAYAGGVMIGREGGLRCIHHAGGAFGFSAEILRFPDQATSVIVVSNAADCDARTLARDVARVVLGGAMQAPRAASAAEEASREDLARFGRMWREEDAGIVWVLTLQPDRKVAATLGDVKFEVEIAGLDRLASVDTAVPVSLEFEWPDGSSGSHDAARMTVRYGGVIAARCRPIPFPPREAQSLDDLVGDYELAAAGAKIRIAVEDGRLRIAQARPILPGPPFVLPPFHALGGDLFLCDAGGQIQFERDASGSVRGLRLDVGRARGLAFERR